MTRTNTLALAYTVVLLTASLSASAASKAKPLSEKDYPKVVAAAKGKVLLVDFWATWCTSCLQKLPKVVALERDLKAKGLKVIAVSTDSASRLSAVNATLAKHKVGFGAYIKKTKDDDAFIRAVSKKWEGNVPAYLLYDKKGKLRHAHFDENEDVKVEKLRKEIEALLKE